MTVLKKSGWYMWVAAVRYTEHLKKFFQAIARYPDSSLLLSSLVSKVQKSSR